MTLVTPSSSLPPKGGSRLARLSNANAFVRPEALNVTPDLLGAPLAPHGRRASAIALDFLCVALISGAGTTWIAVALAIVTYRLRHRVAAAGGSRWKAAAPWVLLAVLAFVAVNEATPRLLRWAGVPVARDGTRASAVVRDDDDVDAAEAAETAAAAAAGRGLPRDRDLAVTAAASAAASAPAGDAAALATARARIDRDAARIARLESDLAEARKPRPVRWRDEVVKVLNRLASGFGWAAVYFTLLPFWWQGQTVGKKLMRLRVVELTGKPLSLITSFGRYGGYAAGLATGGIGFLQVLWDPNRQAVQDKLAHTVVVDLRRGVWPPA